MVPFWRVSENSFWRHSIFSNEDIGNMLVVVNPLDIFSLFTRKKGGALYKKTQFPPNESGYRLELGSLNLTNK